MRCRKIRMCGENALDLCLRRGITAQRSKYAGMNNADDRRQWIELLSTLDLA
jgi:hypothetical protein